jgi:DNA polymerase III epsilon subunit-like protein
VARRRIKIETPRLKVSPATASIGMPYTLIFDTETTGLPINKHTDALKKRNNWPDLVSICWSIFDRDVKVSENYFIIRPDGWTIPDETAAFHGISQEKATLEGKPLAEVLTLLRQDIEKASRLVAHNLEFDKNVLFNAYAWRLQIDPRKFWDSAKEFCSLQTSKHEMKIPGKFPKSNDPYKMPRLDELYQDTFGEPAPANAHNAKRDVEVLETIICRRWPTLLQEG